MATKCLITEHNNPKQSQRSVQGIGVKKSAPVALNTYSENYWQGADYVTDRQTFYEDAWRRRSNNGANDESK